MELPDTIVKGPLKVYRSRCEKIIRTLFLYRVANLAPNGLGYEELMNSVMEWKDHNRDQRADLQDNLDHYEILSDRIALELAQVVKVGPNFRFNPTGSATDPREHFQKARAEAEQNEVMRRQAWEALLQLDKWEVTTRLMTLDLAFGVRSIFRDIAPAGQSDMTLKWRGREINGRVYMRDLFDIAGRGRMLPAVNSAQTGLDYAVFISSTPALDALDSLVESKKDGRVLFWSPDALTPAEESLLVDFAAYRSLIADFSGRDTQEAAEVIAWTQNRLRDQMGTIYRLVPDSYGRGRIAALDHSRLSFLSQGELSAILTPLVDQILDAVYVSKEIEFSAPAPFNDTNAINVINGIVKKGEIPRGAKPNRNIYAAQNYGFALQIMRRPNDRKLDLSECRYTRDINNWIEEKLGDTGASMPAAALYKNFMGLGGPNGLNYGLSRRMTQLYLLALVRQGKIRITLAGRNIPLEAIDYSNIAALDFKVALLESFDQIQRLKPPEGWAALAPFAAVLLNDEQVRRIHQDAGIQTAAQRLLNFKTKDLQSFRAFHSGLITLLEDIEALTDAGDEEQETKDKAQEIKDRLTAWETFLESRIDPANPIPYLRNALDKAFGYRAYSRDKADPAEVDDLAARVREIKRAQDFYRHRDRIRAAAAYAAFPLPNESFGRAQDKRALEPVKNALQKTRALLQNLPGILSAGEARLLSELLEPAESAIQSYAVRYLQVFDQATAHSEQIRRQIRDLSNAPAYRALEQLARVPQLGANPLPNLRAGFANALNSPRLFPANLTRAGVERSLRASPQPPGCPLTLENAGDWLQNADDALNSCQTALRSALLEKAALLHSDALRQRLEQGRNKAFIAGLLKAQSVADLADYLQQTLGNPTGQQTDQQIALLNRYLKQIRVRKLRLAEFEPGKRTIERGDVEQVVGEFRTFLQNALTVGDEDELPIVELE